MVKLQREAGRWEEQYDLAFDALQNGSVKPLTSELKLAASDTHSTVAMLVQQAGQAALLEECNAAHTALQQQTETLAQQMKMTAPLLATYGVIANSYDADTKRKHRTRHWARRLEELVSSPTPTMTEHVAKQIAMLTERNNSPVAVAGLLRDEQRLWQQLDEAQTKHKQLTGDGRPPDPQQLQEQAEALQQSLQQHCVRVATTGGVTAVAAECAAVQLALELRPRLHRAEQQLQFHRHSDATKKVVEEYLACCADVQIVMDQLQRYGRGERYCGGGLLLLVWVENVLDCILRYFALNVFPYSRIADV